MTEALLGVDVGFSARRKTTGVAWRLNGQVSVCLTGSTWEERKAALPQNVTFDLAALDAPLVPSGSPCVRRGCEAAFYRGAFWNRCRPGMSHHGRGKDLRAAGQEAAQQFSAVARTPSGYPYRPVINRSFVEAFPNTFLGVLLPEHYYLNNDSKVSGPKSDWLYTAACAAGVINRLLSHLGWTEEATFAEEVDHDKRAALVCLLTAGFAWAGSAAIFGDEEGGWFWLPPHELWSDWAKIALDNNIGHFRKKGRYPEVALINPAI
jgi:hypothetical protein